MAFQQNPPYRQNKFTSLLDAFPDPPRDSGYLKKLSQAGSSKEQPLSYHGQHNSIYEKVLEFPSGLEHLKYFGYNPHPDKIADESLLFAQPYFNEDLNTPLLQKQIQFQTVKEKL